MSVYPAMRTTKAGLTCIGQANSTGVALIFTKIVFGDGDLASSTSIDDMTDVISPKVTIGTVSGTNKGNGQYQLKGTFDNTELQEGFRAKEIGVFAKAGEDGAETLFAYSNGGNYTDWIPDGSIPIDAQDVFIDLNIGNAAEVTLVIADETYVTWADLRAHDASETAHPLLWRKIAELEAKLAALQEYVDAIVKQINISFVNKRVVIATKQPTDNSIWIEPKFASDVHTTSTDNKLLLSDNTELVNPEARILEDDGAIVVLRQKMGGNSAKQNTDSDADEDDETVSDEDVGSIFTE